MLSNLMRSISSPSSRICWSVAVLAVTVLVAASTWCSEPSETASSEPKGISVGRMMFCRSIKEREPQEAAKEFPKEIEKVYCFTVIVNAGAETHVVHKWYHKGKLMAEVTLKAKGEYWRTWSSKQMAADRTGTWRVDVVSADGKVLKSASFELVAREAEAEEEAEANDAGADEGPVDEGAPDDDDEGDDTGNEDAGSNG